MTVHLNYNVDNGNDDQWKDSYLIDCIKQHLATFTTADSKHTENTINMYNVCCHTSKKGEFKVAMNSRFDELERKIDQIYSKIWW